MKQVKYNLGVVLGLHFTCYCYPYCYESTYTKWFIHIILLKLRYSFTYARLRVYRLEFDIIELFSFSDK